MKEKIEKLLKSHLKRKLTITTATLIAFLLSSNLAMAGQAYRVGNGKIERKILESLEGETNYLGATGLFKISKTSIVNRLKDKSWFTLLEEVNKPFINVGSIKNLTNNGTGKIENKGYIYELISTKENEIENRGIIFQFTSEGNIANKGYIWKINKANNTVNDGNIRYLFKGKDIIKSNITNNGYISEITEGASGSKDKYINSIEKIVNNGIIKEVDYISDLKNSGKIINKGIIEDDLENFTASAIDENTGREIKNYKETNITDTSIDNKILNAYKGKIENNLEVKNNSILNMLGGEIAANKKISIDNSTVNIGNVSYDDGLQLEFKNNSKIGSLYIQPNNSSNDKINNLTIDNTTEVGSIYIEGNIEAINLVPNNTDINRVLIINDFGTETYKNVNTYISTNVDLLGGDFLSGYSDLGNITVKEGGRLTIAKDALSKNGMTGNLYYKKDITIEKDGKIIIGIDPYNIGKIEKLGDGNNLTDSVIGQKNTNIASERLPKTKLNILADSLLHSIVVLDAEEMEYYKSENNSWTTYKANVKNKYKVVEDLNLAKPEPDPKPLPKPEPIPGESESILKNGGKITYKVGEKEIIGNILNGTEYATKYLDKIGLFKISETNIINRLKDRSNFRLLSEVKKVFINEGVIYYLRNDGTGKIENRGWMENLISTTKANEIENRGLIDDFISVGNIANKARINYLTKAKDIINDGYINYLYKDEEIKSNITNNGFIDSIKKDDDIDKNDYINGIERIVNNGIIWRVYYISDLKNKGKVENKGIVINDLENFTVSAADDKGRAIKNYKETNITDTSIDNKILNAYKGKIENNLKVENNSILNMYYGTIAANKLSIDNSTVNMKDVGYNDGLQLEFKNNSKIGGLSLKEASILHLEQANSSNKINNLTIDNTTEVGIIEIDGDMEAINLVPNDKNENEDRVLRLNGFITIGDKNVNTYISTNVDLLGNSELGNITVKDGGRLTIAKDALMNNGKANIPFDLYVDVEYWPTNKKDIAIEKGGKIIIGIDPYNIGEIKELGKGNNLTESVIGQVDTTDPSLRLAQDKLTIDADSSLHDIVVLDGEKIYYNGLGKRSLKNRYKEIEELKLPKPPVTPPSSGGTPNPPSGGTTTPPSSVPPDYGKLNDGYEVLQKAGKIKEFSVYNTAQLFGLYEYLRDMYANSPYVLSAETSFRNLAMLRDNAYLDLKPNLNKWAVMGGLSHSDRENKFKHELGTTEADTITTGAYAKGEYGLKEDTTLGLILGGTNSKSDLLTGKVKGSSIYLGAYAKKYVNNFKFTLGTGLDLGEYKVDRNAIGYAGIIETEKYSAKQKNRAFDLYAEARYSKDLGNNFYLEPNFNLAYSRVRQGSATENDGKINLDIKSKTFNQTTAALGLDLKKVLLNGNTSHSFALGTAYERVLSGAKENSIRVCVVGGSGSGFDILVPEKEKGRTSIGAEYKLENKVGILFNLKMDYGFKHGSDKKDIRFSTGLGYRF